MDWPDGLLPPLSIAVASQFGPSSTGALVAASTNAAFSWPAANQAIYIPVAIPFYFNTKSVWWVNGSTVSSGNMDFGVYTWDGVRIFSTGSTAQSGASSNQRTQLANKVLLVPGSYYFALACDATTNHGFGITGVTTNEGRLGGLLQQASAFPLPAVATFAQWASTGLPLCGISAYN